MKLEYFILFDEIYSFKNNTIQSEQIMATWTCTLCGWEYNEEEGYEDIAAGTKWEDIIDSFECPVCGAGKEDFEKN